MYTFAIVGHKVNVNTIFQVNIWGPFDPALKNWAKEFIFSTIIYLKVFDIFGIIRILTFLLHPLPYLHRRN